MNPDPETLLHQLTPRGANAEVRTQVLAGMVRELERGSRRPWQRYALCAVAAGLLLGIVLNICVTMSYERRLAHLYGPARLDLAPPSDAPIAPWQDQRVAANRRRSPSLPEHWQQIERLLQDLDTVGKEDRREKAQEAPEDRSAAPGRAPRALADYHGHFQLDHQLPA